MDRLKLNEIKCLHKKMPIYLIDGDGAQNKIFIYFTF
jgi:hypothetical protein